LTTANEENERKFEMKISGVWGNLWGMGKPLGFGRNLWGLGKPLGFGETSRVWVLRMKWVLWLFLVRLFHTNDVTPQTPGLIISN
jgi:hypothetical protein